VPGRPGSAAARLRRRGRLTDGRDRTLRGRRAVRPKPEDRELPRLSGRHQRRRSGPNAARAQAVRFGAEIMLNGRGARRVHARERDRPSGGRVRSVARASVAPPGRVPAGADLPNEERFFGAGCITGRRPQAAAAAAVSLSAAAIGRASAALHFAATPTSFDGGARGLAGNISCRRT